MACAAQPRQECQPRRNAAAGKEESFFSFIDKVLHPTVYQFDRILILLFGAIFPSPYSGGRGKLLQIPSCRGLTGISICDITRLRDACSSEDQ